MNGSKIRDHYGAKWLTFILANTTLDTSVLAVMALLYMGVKPKQMIWDSMMQAIPRMVWFLKIFSLWLPP